ncbi:MAG: hypothetical protein ACSW8D_10380, partial [Prevotella sp.]
HRPQDAHHRQIRQLGEKPPDGGIGIKQSSHGTPPSALYRKNRRRYLISLDRKVERDRQPDHCIKCGRCIHEKHCPQNIKIPEELERISQFIEQLRRSES